MCVKVLIIWSLRGFNETISEIEARLIRSIMSSVTSLHHRFFVFPPTLGS